jgi:cardiolipin synthase A/B
MSPPPVADRTHAHGPLSRIAGQSIGPPRRTRDTGTRCQWPDLSTMPRAPVRAAAQGRCRQAGGRFSLDTWAPQQGPAREPKDGFPPLHNVGQPEVRAIGSSPDRDYSPICATRILPSQTDSWLILHAGCRFHDRTLRAGEKCFERQGVILHPKTALIGGVWATVGSTHIDWRSFQHKQELNAVVLGADGGGQPQAMVGRDPAASDVITLDAWPCRGMDLRVKGLLARDCGYWL